MRLRRKLKPPTPAPPEPPPRGRPRHVTEAQYELIDLAKDRANYVRPSAHPALGIADSWDAALDELEFFLPEAVLALTRNTLEPPEFDCTTLVMLAGTALFIFLLADRRIVWYRINDGKYCIVHFFPGVGASRNPGRLAEAKVSAAIKDYLEKHQLSR